MNNFFNVDSYDNGVNNFNDMYQKSLNKTKEDINLYKKLQGQAGDNMNFNMCGYDGNVSKGDLFDVYNGFIRGNMFPNLYNQYKLSRPYDIKPMNEQAELLTKVDAYCFAAHDLNLYLDTHPYDSEMISLFKEISNDSNLAISEYEDKFGPLFAQNSNLYSWSWDNSPWPWEND